MRIAGKHVKNQADGVDTAEDGDLLMYDSTEGAWIPVAAGDIPVSVLGVTATTLNAALLEIFDAISP